MERDEMWRRDSTRAGGCRLGLAALLLALGCGPALAVSKCVAADGRVTYTDGPCEAGSRETRRIQTPPPMSERDQAAAELRAERLKEDARALDARQAREAAERQRREDIERQAEAARQLEAARSTTQVERSTVYYPALPVVRNRLPLPPPPPRPAQQERPPAKMRGYPVFR